MSTGQKIFIIILVVVIWRSPDIITSIIGIVEKVLTTPPA